MFIKGSNEAHNDCPVINVQIITTSDPTWQLRMPPSQRPTDSCNVSHDTSTHGLSQSANEAIAPEAARMSHLERDAAHDDIDRFPFPPVWLSLLSTLLIPISQHTN